MLLSELKQRYVPETARRLEEPEMEWFRNDKLGMFIHWGLYSLLGRGEWVMMNERIDKEEYAKLADRFLGEDMDFRKMAVTARQAGMKYMVLTTRHHDGFALFDSSISDFNSRKLCGRDYVSEFVQACREEGLRVGLYYSPMDWRYEGYFFPEMYLGSALKMREQCQEQLMELMTNYGKIDILWFDGQWLAHGGLKFRPQGWYREENFREDPVFYDVNYFWESEKVINRIRERQPQIMINNRFGWEGDFVIRERTIGELCTDRVWESCDCLTRSWGYIPGAAMMSLRQMIHNLVRITVRDGNYLLNVGPDGRGAVEKRQEDRLEQFGKWLEKFGESIYTTRGGPCEPQEWGGCCWRGNRVYVHILEWTEDMVSVSAEGRLTAYGSLNAQECSVVQEGTRISITVPVCGRDSFDTIVWMEFEEEIKSTVQGGRCEDLYGLGDGLDKSAAG